MAPLTTPRPSALAFRTRVATPLVPLQQMRSLAINPAKARAMPLTECKRVCDLTGKKRNNGYTVSFSHRRNKKIQEANLHEKRFYWEREQRWVRMKVSAKAIRSVEKVGLETMAKRAGIDLYKLPYNDRRPERMQWLANNNAPPRAKNPREPKNYAAINARASYMRELREETTVLIERERERRAAEAEAMANNEPGAAEAAEAAIAAEKAAEEQAEAAPAEAEAEAEAEETPAEESE